MQWCIHNKLYYHIGLNISKVTFLYNYTALVIIQKAHHYMFININI